MSLKTCKVLPLVLPHSLSDTAAALFSYIQQKLQNCIVYTKTYLRNSVEQERLLSLALTHNNLYYLENIIYYSEHM